MHFNGKKNYVLYVRSWVLNQITIIYDFFQNDQVKNSKTLLVGGCSVKSWQGILVKGGIKKENNRKNKCSL